MAEFAEVMKQRDRICETCGCEKCELSSINNGYKLACENFIIYHPQEAEEIIMKWAAEHKAMTRADKIKELFGVTIIGGCAGLGCPPNTTCNTCKYCGYWYREYTTPEE